LLLECKTGKVYYRGKVVDEVYQQIKEKSRIGVLLDLGAGDVAFAVDGKSAGLSVSDSFITTSEWFLTCVHQGLGKTMTILE